MGLKTMWKDVSGTDSLIIVNSVYFVRNLVGRGKGAITYISHVRV